MADTRKKAVGCVDTLVRPGTAATLSHIPEKRLEMEKREDSLWRESALGEDVDVKVGKYLRANHQEYQEIRQQIDVLM